MLDELVLSQIKSLQAPTDLFVFRLGSSTDMYALVRRTHKSKFAVYHDGNKFRMVDTSMMKASDKDPWGFVSAVIKKNL